MIQQQNFNSPTPQNTPPNNLPVEPPVQGYAPESAEPVAPEPIMPESAMPSAPPPPPVMPQTSPVPPVNRPSYTPPMPDFSAPRKRRSFSILPILIVIIVVIIIAGLGYTLYYFATKSYPVVPVVEPPVTNINTNTNPPPSNLPTLPAVPPTTVITFSPPVTMPTDQKQGTCVASIAQPYRLDTFRCSAGGKIYDPCFAVTDSTLVYCQIDPLSSVPFVIKLTTPLPTITLPSSIKDNWAWFLKLKDGTVCSPFTGTNFGGAKPVVNGESALYGCRSNVAGEQVLLMGDLAKGDVWTAQKSVVTKQGTNLVEKSSGPVEIDTVWQ